VFEEEGCSFLKKRTKKLLLDCRGLARGVGAGVKSFLLLFFKKEVLSSFLFVGFAQATTIQDCRTCPTMVVIPPGSFKMGSPDGEPDRPEDPIRDIHIGYSFAVGRTSVTNAQFGDFVAATGYKTQKGCGVIGAGGFRVVAEADWRDPGYGRPPKPDEPVVCVSWRDAKAYAAWLTKITGMHYRLLSEAEWEYAAKAGSTTKFPWGNSPEDACKYANLYDKSAVVLKMPYAAPNCSDGFVEVAPVASFPPNRFGLYDMTGNTWQWVEDCYLYQYPEWPVDGSAIEVYSACPLRSIRGGSWGTRVDRLRPSWRGRDPETRMNILFGFRVARDM
jgi:formylglycine-generating enzyme required for sulfatase activity